MIFPSGDHLAVTVRKVLRVWAVTEVNCLEVGYRVFWDWSLFESFNWLWVLKFEKQFWNQFETVENESLSRFWFIAAKQFSFFVKLHAKLSAALNFATFPIESLALHANHSLNHNKADSTSKILNQSSSTKAATENCFVIFNLPSPQRHKTSSPHPSPPRSISHLKCCFQNKKVYKFSDET